MSELKVNSIKGVAASSAAITISNTDGTCTANLKSISGGQLAGSRNLVINGNMKVHQRAQSVTGTNGGYVTADRFFIRRHNGSVTFNSSVANGVLTCDNPAGSTQFDIRHGIEWDDIYYGKTMTLSFNATAAVGGIDVTVEVMDGGVANTTATVHAHLTGTTTDVVDLAVSPVSGTKYEVTVDMPADGDVSFTPDMVRLRIGNANDDASQSITLSNVQFEFGSVATEFEFEPYGTTALKCARYYHKVPGVSYGGMYDATRGMVNMEHVHGGMRANPTILYSAVRTTTGLDSTTLATKDRCQIIMTSDRPYCTNLEFLAEL